MTLISISILIIIFLDNVIGKFYLGDFHDRTNSALVFLSSIFFLSIFLQITFIHSVWRSRSSNAQIKISDKSFKISSLVIIVSILLNIVTFSFLIFSIMTNMSYDLHLLFPAIIYNVVSAIFILAILATRFVLWFIRNPKLLSLLFILSMVFFVIVLILALSNILLQFENRPSTISPYANPIDRTTLMKTWASESYKFCSITLFLITWLATSILLRKYFLINSPSGSKIFFIIVLFPMIYYFTTSDFVINNLNKVIPPTYFKSLTIEFAVGLTKHIGGIYFAIAFLYMFKNVRNVNLQDSLLFTSFGMMLLFSAITITIILYSTYPPFGLIVISFIPLASFILVYGLYFSVRTIIVDEEFVSGIKQGLRNNDFSFLGEFGKSGLDHDFENTIKKLIEKKIPQEDKQYSTLSNDEIKTYITEVLEEVKKYKS